MTSSVVLDTNAAMLPFTDGTDLHEALAEHVGHHAIVVPISVIIELEMLATEGGARARAAQAALRMWHKAEAGETDLAGDDGVLEVARRLDAPVVTNDRVLESECKRSGLRVLGSRGHGRLAWR